MTQPRSEHPKPQFQREDWINLNGPWTFQIEPRKHSNLSGSVPRDFRDVRGFGSPITVPFAPESPLSGVGDKDFITSICYHRSIEIPENWIGKSVLLHFGAVFYRAEVYIAGRYAGQHVGGSVSFRLDISAFVEAGGRHDLIVSVTNDLWSGTEPSGKQALKYHSYGCHYTRTTGIWQTVWLEAVDPCGLVEVNIVPDIEAGRFVLTPRFHSLKSNLRWEAVATLDGAEKGRAGGAASDGVPIILNLTDPEMWAPGSPTLYDLELRVCDGNGSAIDVVRSYAGLRKVHIEGDQFYLNGTPIYQRLVLDQGFYPDGIWTAPSDKALKQDIELAMAAGFNGARLHQKLFEERFLTWADRLGYLVWGESPSWGLDYCTDGMPYRNFLAEWREIVLRDRNHPSIVAWTPFNETRDYADARAHQRIHEDAYAICETLDPTRPVNDASGYIHHVTDLYTVHSYEQDPGKLLTLLDDQPERGVFRNIPEADAPYSGQPYLIDEFGGIKWDPDTQIDSAFGTGQNVVSWGYGKAPGSLEEFYARLEQLVETVMSHQHICGWCYTQLTDVEQEKNGIYFYDRSTKFDMERIRRIFQMERSQE